MKLVHTSGPGWWSITKVYDPGEKYTSAVFWDSRKDGYANQWSVETKFPDSKFVGIRHETGLCPNTWNRKSWTVAIIERVQA